MNVKACVAIALIGWMGMAQAASVSAESNRERGGVTLTYASATADGSDVHPKRGAQIASWHCARQGYSSVAAEVKLSGTCAASADAGQCASWQIEKTYQCRGNAIAEPQHVAAVAEIPSGDTGMAYSR